VTQAPDSAQEAFSAPDGYLGRFNANYAAQEAMRPIATPAPIDTRSNLMWPVTIGDRADTQWNQHSGELERLSGCVVVNGIRISCGVPVPELGLNPVLGFGDWRLPEKDELTKLVATRDNPQPVVWLRRNWGGDAFTRGANGVVTKIWTATHDEDNRNARHYVMDLKTGDQSLQADDSTATLWPVRNAREKYWL
jgi:hypothetical protein